MSFPISTIKTALYDFCVSATGSDADKVIFAHQGGTEPQGSYIAIIPTLSVRKTTAFDEQILEENGDITVVKRRDVTVQVDAFGPDAITLITAIQDGIDTPEHYAIFEAQCFQAILSSQVRNLADIKNIRYEQRFNLDLTLSVVYTETIDSSVHGWFDTIKADTTTLNPPLGEITITGA